MPVTENKSDLYRDALTGAAVPDSKFVAGRTYTATLSASNAADDLAGSKFLLAELPSDCILSDETRFDVGSWGFAQVQIGTETDATALVNQTKITEDIIDPIVFGDANHGKELWQVLGLASDPGGVIGLWAHAAANATGAGSMLAKIAWIYN